MPVVAGMTARTVHEPAVLRERALAGPLCGCTRWAHLSVLAAGLNLALQFFVHTRLGALDSRHAGLWRRLGRYASTRRRCIACIAPGTRSTSTATTPAC
uniref:Uncharacterized protein n=1 Tax=Ralstonia solanacearum TaxID=305 RepID=A0A0S4TYF1_RALSL|nr:protein of unknown function [Ralstonia solanacearum]